MKKIIKTNNKDKQQRQTTKTNVKQRIVNYMLILFLFYYSYRYILQVNAVCTSPTYSDTPLFWRMLKYILFMPLLMLLGAQTYLRIIYRRSNELIAYLLFFLVGLHFYYTFAGLYEGLATELFVRTLTVIVIFSSVLFCIGGNFKVDVESLGKIFDVYFIYAISYNFVQIFLYFSVGRLPALAYATGNLMHVRFGGNWDDPNTWPMIMAFYFPYVITRYKGLLKWFFAVICPVFTLMAWSGTGVITFAAASIMFFFLRFKDSRLINVFMTMSLVVGIFLALNYTNIKTLFDTYVEAKKGSVSGHAASWTTEGLDPITLLGLYPYFLGGESGFMRLLRAGGIPAVLALYGLMFIAVKRLLTLSNHASSRKEKAVYYGMIAYVISFGLNMLNLASNYGLCQLGIFAVILITVASPPVHNRI